MKRFVTADIHGNLRALKQCLELSKFNKKDDSLVILGDIVDGYPDTKECIESILSLSNYIMVIGNHDRWCLDWFEGCYPEKIWITQGGRETMASYDYLRENIPKSHIDFLKNALAYYISDDNKLFVHGGIDIGKKAENCSFDTLIWDRVLAETIVANVWPDKKLTPYDEVFIGHTTTYCFNTDKPIHKYEVWNLDTGAGWGGRLTIMDVDTKEYWQSDLGTKLYPECKGRG